jgi:hypothetical protein
METIQLEGRTLESHYGRNTDKAPILLARWKNGEGYIPSEADTRLIGIRNSKNAPKVAKIYWDTSTLSATRGNGIKVILPYDNSGNHQLTEAAEFGLSLINPNERLVRGGVNLDVDGRWKKLEGSGVYTFNRKGLILNRDLTEKQARKHPLILTKLGHPDYVDSEFARPIDEVEEIIGRTFELGKTEHGYDTMMGQYLRSKERDGILRACCVGRLGDRSVALGGYDLDLDDGRLVFVSVGDADSTQKGKESVSNMYTPNQIQTALNELGFSELTKTLIGKLEDRE